MIFRFSKRTKYILFDNGRIAESHSVVKGNIKIIEPLPSPSVASQPWNEKYKIFIFFYFVWKHLWNQTSAARIFYYYIGTIYIEVLSVSDMFYCSTKSRLPFVGKLFTQNQCRGSYFFWIKIHCFWVKILTLLQFKLLFSFIFAKLSLELNYY